MDEIRHPNMIFQSSKFNGHFNLLQSADNWWLRSALADDGNNAGNVNDDGNVNNDNVYNDNNYGLASD